MDEQEFIKGYSAKLVAGDFQDVHPQKQYAAGMHGKFTDIVSQLIAAARAKGMTWGKIFSAALQIYSIVSQGGNVQDMIVAIWNAIFSGLTPPPVPQISIP